MDKGTKNQPAFFVGLFQKTETKIQKQRRGAKEYERKKEEQR